MLDKPVVFLSSTMDSQRDLRAAIRKRLEGLNYDVRLAEGTFSVLPGQSIADVCLKNVEHCDILVLLINRHYGTPVKGDWLVRREYVHAKRLDKAICVMIEKGTLHDYKLAIDHPENDPLSAYGIHTGVVKFINEVKELDPWILPFEDPDEAVKKLTDQFSAHYAVLLREKSQAAVIRTHHLLYQMHNLYRTKLHVQALILAGEILRMDPDNADAIVTSAVCRIRLRGLDDIDSINRGIQDCQKVIATNSSDYRARYNLANFKLLSPAYEFTEVKRDLDDLFTVFPDYKYYFDEDEEFKRRFDQRQNEFLDENTQAICEEDSQSNPTTSIEPGKDSI